MFDTCTFERPALKILEHYLGRTVSRVAKSMFRATNTRELLHTLSKLPLKEVNKALAVLLQHNLAEVMMAPQRPPLYRLIKSHVFYLLRHQRYVYHVRQTLGVEAEVLVEKLLEEGRATAPQLIAAACGKLAVAEAEAVVAVAAAKAEAAAAKEAATVAAAEAAVAQQAAAALGAETVDSAVIEEAAAATAAAAAAAETASTAAATAAAMAQKQATGSSEGGSGGGRRVVSVCRVFSQLLTRGYLQKAPNFTQAMTNGSSDNGGVVVGVSGKHFEDEDEEEAARAAEAQFYNAPPAAWLQQVSAEADMIASSVATLRGSPPLPPRQRLPAATTTVVAYTLCHDTFHIHFRNELVGACVGARVSVGSGGGVGEGAQKVFDALLEAGYKHERDKWRRDVNVTAAEIGHLAAGIKHYEHCLTLLETESRGCLRRIGSGGGGEFVVDVAAGIMALTLDLLFSKVTNKFGSKAARVFRLVTKLQVVSPEMVAAGCLLSRKEADQLSTTLLHHHQINVHDLRRTNGPPQPHPAPRDMLFYRSTLTQVVSSTLAQVFTELYNTLQKREILADQNQSLMDKKSRVDAIVVNLRETGATTEQVEEVEEMVSAEERAAAARWMEQQDRLLAVVAGLSDDVMLLQLYLRYYLTMGAVRL